MEKSIYMGSLQGIVSPLSYPSTQTYSLMPKSVDYLLTLLTQCQQQGSRLMGSFVDFMWAGTTLHGILPRAGPSPHPFPLSTLKPGFQPARYIGKGIESRL